MKRLISIILGCSVLFASAVLTGGCTSEDKVVAVSDVVLYKDGMDYTVTEKGTPKEVYSLSYDIIGGKDVMPIGGFFAPYASGGSIDGNDATNFVSDEIFQLIAESGVNIMMYSHNRWGGETANRSIKQTLKFGEKYHIGSYVDAGWIMWQMGSKLKDVPLEEMDLTKPDGRARLEKLVDDIACKEELDENGNKQRYKSFIGLMSLDEPFEQSLDNMKVLFDMFYSLDNTKGLDLYTNSLGEWTDTNNFWGYSDPMMYDEYAEKFFEIKPRMYSVTQYPYGSKNTKEETLVDNLFGALSTYRRLANKNKVPHWRMLQAGGQFNDRELWIDTQPPYPSEGELLYDVNISLAYGAKGIQYFPLIQPQHFAYQTGDTYDYANRNGLIGGDGNKTRWFYYAKRANEQIRAIDEYLMNSASEGIIVHGDKARGYIVTPENGRGAGEELIDGEKFRQLSGVYGDDCVIGCFDYKGGTALYVVNYNRKQKGNVILKFDNNYKYKVIQRATEVDVVGSSMGLTLDPGEGALIVLD